MVDETYFFDSYAVFEMLEGNPGYELYRRSLMILTKLALEDSFVYVTKLCSSVKN